MSDDFFFVNEIITNHMDSNGPIEVQLTLATHNVGTVNELLEKVRSNLPKVILKVSNFEPEAEKSKAAHFNDITTNTLIKTIYDGIDVRARCGAYNYTSQTINPKAGNSSLRKIIQEFENAGFLVELISGNQLKVSW